MTTYYVTTPIYYVNDLPHVGHIYTTLVADTVARYRRLRGDSVYFLTGTDEHGQKIERAARDRGIEPIALADEVVERYHQLWRQLGVSHDDFLRTSEERHAIAVRAVIERIAASDDFYVDKHEGWYCVRCEVFYTDKELEEGEICPIHGTACEWRSEDNVFFRLSAYQDRLLQLYDENPEFVRPESRRNEVRNFVAQGLRDLSVSRSSVDWAVPFPGHEGQTVYVWLDALVNYISALGYGSDDAEQYERLWSGTSGDGDPTVVHLVGKDILRFHTVYWPAFLLSAGLPLPTTVWAHGWWLQDDRKVSKSAGNVVRPDHLIDRFGGDPLRLFLLREMVFGADAQFSDEAFAERYNTDLANDLGNTSSRLVTLSRRAFSDHTPPAPDAEAAPTELREIAERSVSEYLEGMDEFAFRDALDAVFRLLGATNQYLVQEAPWKAMKDPERRDDVARALWNGLEALRLVATMLLPVLPESAPKVLAAIGAPEPESPEDTTDFVERLAWGGLPGDVPLPPIEPLFPRIDMKAFVAELETPVTEIPVTETPATETLADETLASQPAASEPTGDSKAAEPVDPPIDIDQFFAVQLRVATIRAAEPVPKSNKLLKLEVDVGEAETRTVVAGIAKAYAPDELVDRQVVVVANLKPAKLMGVRSNGMVLAASEDGQPILLHPDRPVPPGTQVR